jgi:hypothetical protein
MGDLTELKDLEKDMKVGLAAIQQDDGSLLAKVVAAGVRGDGEGNRVPGQVTAVGVDSLSVETRDGSMTFRVDANTKFVSEDGSVGDLGDLTAGDTLVVAYDTQDDGSLLALGVLVADGERPQAERAAGTVQSAGGSHLTIVTREGDMLNFTVTDKTRYFSPDDSLSGLGDLKNGDPVAVVYIHLDDGGLQAIAVASGAGEGAGKIERARGQIGTLSSSSLTVETDGGSLTFTVDGNTKFVSEDDSLSGLGDLSSGQVVVVGYVTQDDGSLLAKVIGAGTGSRPEVQRAQGTVQSAGGSHLTIQANDGSTLKFTVTDKTKYFSPDDSLSGLDDLKNGMPVVVGYITLDDGTLQAIAVGTGRP